ncbi:dimer_Tnp_hAT domain-containing protein [Trichonephila clavipes]|nr:dimer_Tnp_hAT domain-containing protein [Trichonephila clavipes]
MANQWHATQYFGHSTAQNNYGHNEILRVIGSGDLIPDAFINYLKKLSYAILTTYACESLFSRMNKIKAFLRNHLADDSNAACILLKVTSYNPNTGYLSSNLQQQKSRCFLKTCCCRLCHMSDRVRSRLTKFIVAMG